MSDDLKFSDLAGLLRERPELVTDRYCSHEGAYTDHHGRYFCLNPMRADKTVGSFFVHMRGPSQGRWYDFSTGDGGDVLDLVREVDRLDTGGAARAAKQLLGIVQMDAATRQRLDEDRNRREERTMFARKQAEATANRVQRQCQFLYLHAEQNLIDTPVDLYLRGRCIELEGLVRQPGAIRFMPECYYRRDDPETGEIFEAKWPAMVAGIVGADGKVMGLHRTYLADDGEGRWIKAPVPDPKKILGRFREGAIRLWSGTGPRGGKGCSLAEAQHGTRVYVTEGIEDGLSCVVLKPEARVLVAISLDNMARIALPECVTEIVLVADNDAGEQAQDLLQRAIETHQRAGRTVRVWRAQHGKDINDDLRHAYEAIDAA